MTRGPAEGRPTGVRVSSTGRLQVQVTTVTREVCGVSSVVGEILAIGRGRIGAAMLPNRLGRLTKDPVTVSKWGGAGVGAPQSTTSRRAAYAALATRGAGGRPGKPVSTGPRCGPRREAHQRTGQCLHATRAGLWAAAVRIRLRTLTRMNIGGVPEEEGVLVAPRPHA